MDDKPQAYTKSVISKLLPIAFIMIPLMVVGFFLVLDEKEHAVNLIDRKQDDSGQATRVDGDEVEVSWDEQLRVRWAGSTFADFIKGITILQHQAHHDTSIIRFNSYDLPQEPKQVAYHLDQYPNEYGHSIHINIDLKYDWDNYYDEVLGNWLNVEGAQSRIYLDDMSKRSFKVVLDQYYMNSIHLDIDGLPRLTLVPMDPLTYEVVETAWDIPALYLNEVFPMHPASLVLDSATSYVQIIFSEQMIEEDHIGQQYRFYSGEWVDTKTYRFNINSNMKRLDMQDFYSLSGNYLQQKSLAINWRDANSNWVNYSTKEKVSDISTFFDAILYAPNQRDYLGFVIEEDEANGYYYSLVYHKKGEEPQALRLRHYSNVVNYETNLPAYWINNQKIMLYSSQEVELIDLNQQMSELLFKAGPTTSIQSIAVDKSNQCMLLYVVDTSASVERGNNVVKPSPYGDIKLYSLSTETGHVQELVDHTQPYFDPDEAYFHGYHTLTMINHSTGLYLPYYNEEGRRMTRWISNNVERHIEGHPLLAFDEGVWLRDMTFGEHGITSDRSWWINQQRERIAMEAPATVEYKKIGHQLIRVYPEYEPTHKTVVELLNKQDLTWHALKADIQHPLIERLYPPLVKEQHLTPQIKELLSMP